MSKGIKQKIGRVTKSLATTGLILYGSIMLRELAYGAGTAVQLDFLDNLGATVIDAMKGAGSLVIDAIIIAVVGMFSSVLVIRYIKGVVKKSGFKRKVFFKGSDVIWRRKVKYYGKYYL